MDKEKTPTTREAVTAYESTRHVFSAVIKEIRELSRKKPDITMSKFKVGQINRILADIKTFLAAEPDAKFLDLLDDEALPQVGDAVVVMSQFEAALNAFVNRHHHYDQQFREHRWFLSEGKTRNK